MNSELIKTVEIARTALKESAALLRKVATSEDIVEHRAEADTKPAVPMLDEAGVRDTFETMAVAHLAKSEEIDGVVECVMKDPNELLGVIEKLALRLSKVASPDADKGQETRRPGKLVEKTASAFGTQETSVDRMKRRCAEAARKLQS